MATKKTFTSAGDESRAAVVAARLALSERSEALERAEETLAEVECTMGQGGVAPHDLITARAAVEIAEAQRGTARAALTAAEGALIPDDLSLASVVADGVSAFLGGIPTAVATVRPTAAPESLPVVVVVQPAPHDVSPRGALSGIVEVHYLRTRLHRPLDIAELGNALDAQGVTVERSGGRGGGMFVKGISQKGTLAGVEAVDVLGLNIRSAFAAVPVIPRNARPGLDALAFTIQDTAREAMGTRAPEVHLPGRGNIVRRDDLPSLAETFGQRGPARRPVFSMSVDDVRMLNASTDADGIRRQSVEAVGKFRAVADGPDTRAQYESKVIAAQVGKALGGLGRVESATVTGSAFTAPDHSRPSVLTVTARFEFLSRAI